ncbi:MAG: indole-3-glycerol phosphate synthase TrpC, partial [Chloroflexota bacterium]
LRAANGVALIAEVKKASPSKGLLRANFDPVDLATQYIQHGASAVSVLTDAKYFQGQLEFITEIQEALEPVRKQKNVGATVLRKDFIVDPYQVYQAKLIGADALLLIAACLSDKEMADLLKRTRQVGMTALIEVHTKEELDRVLPLNPRLVGVNNRNLHDFSVDLNTCIELRQHVPDDICFVAESGIHTRADVQRLAKEGVNAILVGEAIVKQKDVGRKVNELSGVTMAEVAA